LYELVCEGSTVAAAGLVVGCSRQTASKWVARGRRGEGFADRSSRPHRSPGRTPLELERVVLRARAELRLGPHPLGWLLGLAASTVHAILARHGQSRLGAREPREPVVRYEREQSGELLHLDIKPLGRIARPLAPGESRRQGRKGRAGWSYLFAAVDDHTRLAHAQLYPAESTVCAPAFLDACSRFYSEHGISIQAVLTDNGKCFKHSWNQGCHERQITPRRTRIRRPQTNGKVERFIRTLLEEWARTPYPTEQLRALALSRYLDFYNQQRPHRALKGLTPLQRARQQPPRD
jgi:transposase InsO family protein